MAFHWSQELETGVDIIDQQHREIFHRGNLFVESCKSGKGREALLDTLNFLAHYVEDHFGQEEQLMAAHNYPDMEQHIEQHQDFRAQVRSLHEQVSEHGPSFNVLADTNQKILDWLIGHIKKTDRALGSFLRNQWGLF